MTAIQLRKQPLSSGEQSSTLPSPQNTSEIVTKVVKDTFDLVSRSLFPGASPGPVSVPDSGTAKKVKKKTLRGGGTASSYQQVPTQDPLVPRPAPRHDRAPYCCFVNPFRLGV